MNELPHTHCCFVCGDTNPHGLKLRFETDGRLVRARFVPRAQHVDFRHTVHGGLVATLLDEVMVWAIAVQTRRFAFSAELRVRYQKPVRPDEEVYLTGELVSNRRDKLFAARAALKDAAGGVLATGTGKYLPIPQSQAQEMAADFVGDAGWFFPARAL